jgi:hypothetical protein
MTNLSENLIERLTQADLVCKDCGGKYGKYSVGCSSTWESRCHVCGETKPVTEVRDWGYLAKGIAMAKAQANIRDQEKAASLFWANQWEVSSDMDAELEEELIPSYEQGEISCSFNEDEIAALRQMLSYVEEDEDFDPDEFHKTVINKVRDLYDDNCVSYELTPEMKAYQAKYGTGGTSYDDARWEGFRDAYLMLTQPDSAAGGG